METHYQTGLPHNGGPFASTLLGMPHLDQSNYVRTEQYMSIAGGFSDVVVGYVAPERLPCTPMCLESGEVKVAVKRFRFSLLKNNKNEEKYEEKYVKALKREIIIWASLGHPNILPFLGYMLENGFPSLISEWMGDGTAREFVEKNPECDIIRLVSGIAEGLKYIHGRGYVHSDIKADNVLMSPSREPLICDFGISRMLDSVRSDFVSTTHDGKPRGTIRFMAIELLLPKQGEQPKHSMETDVWAFGMTIYELASGGLPYADLEHDALVVLAMNRRELPDLSKLRVDGSANSKLCRICKGCWAMDPRARLTMEEITSILLLSSDSTADVTWTPLLVPAVLPVQGEVGQRGLGLEVQITQHHHNSPGFPPLGRDRFTVLLQEWWKRTGITFDPRMMTIGNRQIDINLLHQLHTEILQLGGVDNVQRHGLWNDIAAKMGWTPVAINESGHTQDRIAEQIKVVYDRLLQSFDQAYMGGAIMWLLQRQQQQQQPPLLEYQLAPNLPGSASGQSSNLLLAQQALQMIKPANMSAEQLRANGYPKIITKNIEKSRPQLPRRQPFPNRVQAAGPLQNPSLLTQDGASNVNSLGHPGISAGSSPSIETPSPGQQRPVIYPSQSMKQGLEMLSMLPNLRKLTTDMVMQASAMIEQLEVEVSREQIFRPDHVRHLSDADKDKFPALFQSLYNIIRDISRYQSVYLAATNDLPIIRGIINMLDMCDKQRQLLQSSTPVYILDIGTLQRLTETVLEVKSKISTVVRQLRLLDQMEQQNQARVTPPPPPLPQVESGPSNPPPVPQGQSSANIGPYPASIPPRPPTVQPPPQPLAQQNPRPPARTPQMAPARPSSVAQSRGKGPAGTSPNATDAIPSPSPSTPLPSGTTPSHAQSSPQTQKLPKTKTQPKPRPSKRRRQSKVVQPNANAAPAAPAAASVAPTAPAATTAVPATEPAPSPAQAAPSPAEPHLKRSREEEPTDQTGPNAPPGDAAGETPLERAKTDWENVPDAGPSKRRVEAENIKTTCQAAQFYSNMTQILELSNDTALPPELHKTLAQLVKTVGNGLEVPDAAGSSSMSMPNAGSSSPKAADGDDSFFSFLDFTALQQDDDKADTPELVPASSTNPNPVSRNWGDVDGGGSGYFNSSDMWEWDNVDNSGVIST